MCELQVSVESGDKGELRKLDGLVGVVYTPMTQSTTMASG